MPDAAKVALAAVEEPRHAQAVHLLDGDAQRGR